MAERIRAAQRATAFIDIVAIARTWSTTSVFPPPLSFSSIAYRKWFEGDWKSHPETVIENFSVSCGRIVG